MRVSLDDVDVLTAEQVRRHSTVGELVTWADRVEPGSETNRASLLVHLGEQLGYAGRADEALQLFEAAVADGGFVPPDARLYLASALLERDERAAAEALFDAVRADRPTDPMVYEYVGEQYELAEDLSEAARWFTLGWSRCLKDEDAPVQDVLQLAIGRRRVRLAEGLPPDDLDAVAEQALAARQAPRRLPPGQVLQAFVPAEGWDTWPFATLPVGTFEEQVGLIERELREEAAGSTVRCVPLDPAGLAAFAESHGLDPDTTAARTSYAEHLDSGGRGVAWPPGRNEPCWCGSAAKYKKCCGRPLPS